MIPRLLSVTLALLVCAVACKKRGAHHDPAPAPPPRVPAPTPALTTSDASSPTPQEPFAARVARTTALDPTPREAILGTQRVRATRCVLDGAPLIADAAGAALTSIAFDRRGALYVIDGEQHLRRYQRARGEGCNFALDASFGSGGIMAFAIAVTHASIGRGGTLAVSGPRGSYLLDDGAITVRCDRSGHGRVWLARSGVGYGLLANNSMRRVEYDDGACSIDPWTYEHPLRSIVAVAAIDENLYLAGTDPASGAVQIRVADERGHDRGNLGATNAQADDGFCSVSALGECNRGLCVLDTTCDRVRVWSKRGRHIGNVTASMLLGATGLTLTAVVPEGRETFIAATARREPAAAAVHEGLLFAVRGL